MPRTSGAREPSGPGPGLTPRPRGRPARPRAGHAVEGVRVAVDVRHDSAGGTGERDADGNVPRCDWRRSPRGRVVSSQPCEVRCGQTEHADPANAGHETSHHGESSRVLLRSVRLRRDVPDRDERLAKRRRVSDRDGLAVEVSGAAGHGALRTGGERDGPEDGLLVIAEGEGHAVTGEAARDVGCSRRWGPGSRLPVLPRTSPRTPIPGVSRASSSRTASSIATTNIYLHHLGTTADRAGLDRLNGLGHTWGTRRETGAS